MSGPFGSSQWMYSSGAAFYPIEIEQSLRFNDNDSAYLSRTPASTTNRKTWTYSVWAKVAKQDSYGMLLEASDGSGNNEVTIGIDGLNKLVFYSYIGGYQLALLSSANLIRDPSAWYHFVFVADTTQATSSERARVYINGERLTSFSTETYPSQNYDTYMNLTQPHSIGRNRQVGRYFDGYMAEAHLIDGQALDPTYFGEFKSGVWVAKEYTGSYGTNGFYLNFSDSAAIGDDLSGNANDWTANNLVATDVVLDSPTNNFCTLNPVDKRSGSNVNEANLFIGPVSGNHYWARGSIKIPNDQKIYLEALAGDNGSGSIVAFFGIIEENSNPDSGAMDNGVACNSADFYKHVDGSGSSQGSSVLTAGDIVGLAFDMPNSTMTIYKNGSVTTNAVSFTAGEFYLYLSIFFNSGGTPSWVLNAGQDSSFGGRKTRQGNTDDNDVGDFYYSPPSGYLALCTANLPDPAIDPAKDDVPADYFNTVLWTGDGTAPRSITGVGFQPDWVWIKGRNAAWDHHSIDVIRGANNYLKSSSTAAESSSGAGNEIISSFDSDGFSLATSSVNGNSNNSGSTYVGWNWLAGNGTSSNTDGSITSTVSVNQKAGFSIVSWTGNGVNSAQSIGHGLGATPSLVITKNRDQGAYNWQVLHGATPDRTYNLNTNDAGNTGWASFTNGSFDPSNLSSTTFSTKAGTSTSNFPNGSGEDYIAYCFAEIPSYSAFGKYVGNGSSDGPFVYTGFRPAWILTKDTTSTEQWYLIDNARDPYNVANKILHPNLSSAEATNNNGARDMLSNGFKVRAADPAINGSGRTYIFMAFAENPFKYANAR